MRAIDAARAYFQGWNDQDADAVLAALTDDGTYEDPGTGGPISGALFRGYMAGLWSAFPEVAFEIESIAETAPDAVAAQWVMTGTDAGGLAGLPPTGRSIRLRGADFLRFGDGKLRSVTGYFDTGEIPRQIGLDIIVQPKVAGPFRFGTSVMVQTGSTREPGAFSITVLEAPDEAAAGRVTDGSRAAMGDMLRMEGFIAATTAKIGLHMVSISAWDGPDESRRVMREGAHMAVMRDFYGGGLVRGGYTSVWIKHRINPIHIRCDACGLMNHDPDADRRCACGATLPAAYPYW